MQQTLDQVLTREQQQQNREELLQDITDKAQELYLQVNTWLDSRSEFYSRLMEEDITWRQSLRAGVVLPILFTLTIGCVTVAPLVALPCLATAAWVTYRVNKTDEQQKKRKR